MEGFLAGRFAVGEKEVDTLASETRAAQTCGRRLADAEHLSAVFRLEVSEEGSVHSRDDKHVARRNGLNVHQRERTSVFMNDAHLAFSRSELAEKAIAVL